MNPSPEDRVFRRPSAVTEKPRARTSERYISTQARGPVGQEHLDRVELYRRMKEAGLPLFPK
jgi:hypothetical protein